MTQKQDSSIRVGSELHSQAKQQAEERGMTLKGYIKYLINKDAKVLEEQK